MHKHTQRSAQWWVSGVNRMAAILLSLWCLQRPVMAVIITADSRFVPGQWETALLCNDASHWLGASLESALIMTSWQPQWYCSHKAEVAVKFEKPSSFRQIIWHQHLSKPHVYSSEVNKAHLCNRYLNGLEQEISNSSVSAMGLRLSCTNQLIFSSIRRVSSDSHLSNKAK